MEAKESRKPPTPCLRACLKRMNDAALEGEYSRDVRHGTLSEYSTEAQVSRLFKQAPCLDVEILDGIPAPIRNLTHKRLVAVNHLHCVTGHL